MKRKISYFIQCISSAICIYMLAACGSTLPKVNLSNDLYPAAYIAEPIRLRAGAQHTTQEFEIRNAQDWLEISLGFSRRDDLMPFKRFQCLVMSRKDLMRIGENPTVRCPNDEPGVSVEWNLLRVAGDKLHTVAAGQYDALTQKPNGTYARNSVTVGLGGVGQQLAGTYRINIIVLRDFNELDSTDPQILVNLPFFHKK